MSTLQVMTVFVVVWALIGISAAVVFLGRQGYRDWRWYLIGGILGLLFVPIAAERARRETKLLERISAAEAAVEAAEAAADRAAAEGAAERAAVADGRAGGISVLVGVDGSTESDQALRDLRSLLGGSVSRVILVTVVDAGVGEYGNEETQRRSRELLRDRGRWLADLNTSCVLEIASGQPARVLLDLADAEQVDVLVVGRRGRGLSHRILGSVAKQLVSNSFRPVLLAGQVQSSATSPAATSSPASATSADG